MLSGSLDFMSRMYPEGGLHLLETQLIQEQQVHFLSFFLRKSDWETDKGVIHFKTILCKEPSMK